MRFSVKLSMFFLATVLFSSPTVGRCDTWEFIVDRLTIANQQESSGDEPYFIVMGFRSQFNTLRSTRTFWSGDLREIGSSLGGRNAVVDVPEPMGIVDFGHVDMPRPGDELEILGALVISMEHDGTSFSRIRSMMTDVETAVEREIRRLIERGELDLLDTGPGFSTASANIRDAVTPSIWQALDIWVSSGFDPDDIIDFDVFTFPVLAAPLAGFPALEERDIFFTAYQPGTNWWLNARLESHDDPWTGAGHRGHGFYVGDFDGDGADDIFRQTDQWGGAEVLVSNGVDAFADAGRWVGNGAYGYGWTVGDFNGDGRDDIFRQINQWGGAEVFLSIELSNGTQRFAYAGRWTGSGHRGYGWYVGDFDGDGDDDIFRQVNQWGGAEVFLSNRVNQFVYAGRWTGSGARGYGWKIGDFDGDGDDDIFRQRDANGGAEMFISTGSRFVLIGTWTFESHNGYGWHVGDFDGDGDDDIFKQVNQWGGAEVLLSNGVFFHNAGVWTGRGNRGYGWTLGDFDGDGDVDIFRQVNQWGGAEVFRASPGAFLGDYH